MSGFNPEEQELYQFKWSLGRLGKVEGLFFTKPEALKFILGKEVYFGEILGKHSEISGVMRDEYFHPIPLDKEAKTAIYKATGRTLSGHNPVVRWASGYLEDHLPSELPDDDTWQEWLQIDEEGIGCNTRRR